MKDKNGDEIVIGQMYEAKYYVILAEKVNPEVAFNVSGPTFCKNLDDCSKMEWDSGCSEHLTPTEDTFYRKCFEDKVRYLKLDELKVGEIYQDAEGDIFRWENGKLTEYYLFDKEKFKKFEYAPMNLDRLQPATEQQIETFNKLIQERSEKNTPESAAKEEKPVVKGFNVIGKTDFAGHNEWYCFASGVPYKTSMNESYYPDADCWELEPNLPKPTKEGYEFEYKKVGVGEKYVGDQWDHSKDLDTYLIESKVLEDTWRWVVTSEQVDPPKPTENTPKENPPIKINGQLLKVGEPVESEGFVYTLDDTGNITTSLVTVGCCEPESCWTCCEPYAEVPECCSEEVDLWIPEIKPCDKIGFEQETCFKPKVAYHPAIPSFSSSNYWKEFYTQRQSEPMFATIGTDGEQYAKSEISENNEISEKIDCVSGEDVVEYNDRNEQLTSWMDAIRRDFVVNDQRVITKTKTIEVVPQTLFAKVIKKVFGFNIDKQEV